MLNKDDSFGKSVYIVNSKNICVVKYKYQFNMKKNIWNFVFVGLIVGIIINTVSIFNMVLGQNI